MSEDLSGLPPAQPEESGDLADHEAQFGPNGTGEAPEPAETTAEAAPAETTAEQKARDEQGRFQKAPRHRAKSQQASPADVPRIQELTAKLRAAEARAAELERRTSPAPAPAAPAPPSVPAQVPPSGPERGVSGQPSPPQAWTPPATRPKPSEDQVGDKYPTYAEFVEDLAEWKAEQRDAVREARQAAEKQQQTYREWNAQYEAQYPEIIKTTPDFDAVMAQANAATQAAGLVVPQVLVDAIRSSEHGRRIEYWLATHQQDYHELIRDAWAVNQFSSIGMVRRVLESRLPSVVAPSQRPTREAAGSTGAAPTLSVVPAPRPPTPVRTGPLKSSDEPPDDDAGLEAHEAHYYRNKR